MLIPETFSSIPEKKVIQSMQTAKITSYTF